MKKCKKLLSSILALTIIATLFSGVGNIFSGAETFEELKTTKKLVAYNSDTAAEDLQKDWAPGGTSSLININANPDHRVAGGGTNLYSDYMLEMNSPNNYAYAKEGGKYYVDWAKNTVTSVSYTVLPCAFLGNNGNWLIGLKIYVGKDQFIRYGFGSDRYHFRSGNLNDVLELNFGPTLKYYYNDTLVTGSNYNALFGKSVKVANEIKITINYTKKDDGKTYILKNIVAEVDPKIKISDVEGVTAKSVATDNTVTITPTKEKVINDPQFCLPCSGDFTPANQFYFYTYIKDASITYYENPDNSIPEFVNAYNALADVTVDNAADYRDAINNCWAEYEKLDATHKSYVGDTRLARLTELCNALRADEIAAKTEKAKGEIKTSSILKDRLSDADVAANMWQYTCLQDYGKYVFSQTTDNENLMYKRWFDTANLNNFGFSFNGTTATQNITGKIYKPDQGAYENNLLYKTASGLINYVKKDFVPEDVSNISATVSLHPGSYNIFFGENANLTAAAYTGFKYNDGTSEENDFPRYGIRILIKDDGTVDARYIYVSILDGNKSGRTAFKDKYITSVSQIDTTNPLEYSTNQGKALDMKADKLTISLDLSHKYTKVLDGSEYTYIHPVITLKDSKGNVISQAATVSNASKEEKLGATPHITAAKAMPTAVTGFAISSYDSTYNPNDTATNGYVSAPYTDTLTLYDFDMVGAATVNALGASIKKTATVSEQDVRFGFTFGGENSYLVNQGYTVKNYGAVVAINGALESGDSLTKESTYKAEYATLGGPVVKTIEGAPEYGSQYNVQIGLSARDPKKLGLVYRVRPFITYSKAGEEDIVIYSEDSSATNAYTPRSVFSTAKNIAKAMVANSAFVQLEEYAVGEKGTVAYSEIKAIFDGTNTGKSYDKIDGTEIMLAEALTAFTAHHKDLVS